MDLTHRFTVPTAVEETWAHFQDIASVAECFPGATVASVDDDSFSGSVKVKLGPIALVYNGSGTFVEKDDAEHRFVVDAKGRDKRGNGTAGAKVTLTMAPAGADGGSTDVEVVTDLAITGKPAQFGRGVMQDVSDKLLGQFVTCLEQRLGAGEPEPELGQEQAAVPAEATAPAEAVGESALGAGSAAASGIVPDDSVVDRPEEPRKRQGLSQEPPPPAPAGPTPAASQQDDALDLGAAVLPVLAKTYWKQAVGAGLLVALVLWLVSRRRSS